MYVVINYSKNRSKKRSKNRSQTSFNEDYVNPTHPKPTGISKSKNRT